MKLHRNPVLLVPLLLLLFSVASRAMQVREKIPEHVLARECGLDQDGLQLVMQAGPRALAGTSPYDPAWGSVAPALVVTLDYDPTKSSAQNGAGLVAAVQALAPGTKLLVGPGTYSIESFFSIDGSGTPRAPIWIESRGPVPAVLTRSNAQQNVVNLGSNAGARFLVLRGFEITGGSSGVRFFDCENVWLDRCRVHHTGETAITASSVDTAELYMTRNEVHHTGGKGEGIYIGANNGAVVTHGSVIALNHVHDTGGTQGDGIELKQGSWGNWIAENVVHDTPNPCILLYGTGGQALNLVERNVLWDSGDNVLQVQGEAVVRANLIVDGAVAGFHSHDHQGESRHLTFVHNTIVNSGRAVNLVNWSGRPGMVCANNAAYSLTGSSLHFGGGAAGVALAGNVVVGPVVGTSAGFVPGQGLADFADLDWDASGLDAQPAPAGALIGSAAPAWLVPLDLTGGWLAAPFEAGCLDAP